MQKVSEINIKKYNSNAVVFYKLEGEEDYVANTYHYNVYLDDFEDFLGLEAEDYDSREAYSDFLYKVEEMVGEDVAKLRELLENKE